MSQKDDSDWIEGAVDEPVDNGQNGSPSERARKRGVVSEIHSMNQIALGVPQMKEVSRVFNDSLHGLIKQGFDTENGLSLDRVSKEKRLELARRVYANGLMYLLVTIVGILSAVYSVSNGLVFYFFVSSFLIIISFAASVMRFWQASNVKSGKPTSLKSWLNGSYDKSQDSR